MRLFINALGFQAAWWACIAGVGQGLEIAALIFCFVLAGLHLCFASQPRQEIRLAALALALGVLTDTLLQMLDVISFYGWTLGPLSPFWLWMLWVMFALTLNTSLAFLKTQPLWISALAGLVFGPITYYAGAKLGAAAFDGSFYHFGALALAWALAMPALIYLAKTPSTLQQGPP
jgi:hypothetical protein